MVEIVEFVGIPDRIGRDGIGRIGTSNRQDKEGRERSGMLNVKVHPYYYVNLYGTSGFNERCHWSTDCTQ